MVSWDHGASMREAVIAGVERRRDDWVGLIQELVQIPSIVGTEEVLGCQKLVKDAFTSLGLTVESWVPDATELRDRPGFVEPASRSVASPVVVGRRVGTGAGRSLVLNGHVDVVPINPARWSVPPWGATLVEDRLYGRGALDMKAGIAAMIASAWVLGDLGVKLSGDVVYASVGDEEESGNHTLACIFRGYTGDGTLFLEPSPADMTLVPVRDPVMLISSRGAQFFRIVIHNPNDGGVEYQHEVMNPVGGAAYLVRAIEAYAEMRESSVKHALYANAPTKVPLAVCRITGGEWPSTITDEVTMEGTIECLPGEDLDEVKAAFERYLLRTARGYQGLRESPPRLEWFGLRYDPAETDGTSDFVTTVASVVRGVTGLDPQITGGGGNDLRHTVLRGHSPSVIYGPGGGRIHSTDEWVSLASVRDVIAAVVELCMAWCGPGSLSLQ